MSGSGIGGRRSHCGRFASTSAPAPLPQDDQRERQVEQEQRDKGRAATALRNACPGAPDHAQHGLHDNGEHRRLDPGERCHEPAEVRRDP
jgi:hypothetical protein